MPTSRVAYELEYTLPMEKRPLYIEDVEILFRVISATYYGLLLAQNHDNETVMPTVDLFRGTGHWNPMWARNLPEDMRLEITSLSFGSPFKLILEGLEHVLKPLLDAVLLPWRIGQEKARMNQEKEKLEQERLKLNYHREKLKQMTLETKFEEDVKNRLLESIDREMEQLSWRHAFERAEDVLDIAQRLDPFLPEDTPPDIRFAFARTLISSMVAYSSLPYEITSPPPIDSPDQLLTDGRDR